MKSLTRTAGARVFAAQFFGQHLVAVNDPDSALDLRLGRESAASLATDLETSPVVRRCVAWHCSFL
ncbi:MAG TPA: hypothetical protein VM555_07850, partial [Tahibacter sp.]|nr:hypothetical protein [Tahibacter sp.]